MILTDSEFSDYATNPNLEGAFSAYLPLAQQIAESQIGANRPLEISSFVEIYPISRYRSAAYGYCYLHHRPIVADSLSGRIRSLDRSVSLPEFVDLPSDALSVDRDGKVNVFWGSLSRYPYYGRSIEDFLVYCEYEVEITYESGLDFTADTPEVKELKSAIANLICYLDNPSYKGIAGIQIPFREFKLDFNKSETGTIPAHFLIPFMKYRPVVI
jgi:hypothetical protein